MASTIQITAKKEIHRVKSVHDNGSVLLQGKCGVTLLNNVCNVAPCHLTDIDPTIDHTLARPDKNVACECAHLWMKKSACYCVTVAEHACIPCV